MWFMEMLWRYLSLLAPICNQMMEKSLSFREKERNREKERERERKKGREKERKKERKKERERDTTDNQNNWMSCTDKFNATRKLREGEKEKEREREKIDRMESRVIYIWLCWYLVAVIKLQTKDDFRGAQKKVKNLFFVFRP
jgi:hypothetical protein